MPMEVFTISGPPTSPFPSPRGTWFGAGPDVIWRNPATGLEETHRAGWKPPTSAYAVTRTSGGSAGSPPVALQNALKALGDTHGDSALNVSIDGAIGPATVKATNHALSAYIGAGPLQAAGLTAPQFLQARLTKSDIQRYAGALAAVVATAVRLGGGFVPPPPANVGHGGGGGGSRASAAAAQAAANASIPDSSTLSSSPNMVWFVIGGAALVLGLGFYAAHKRAT
jgi:hypothetical protein